MARTNNKLTSARVNKNDEFYTRLVDIEAEAKHYKNEFKNKTVICNCDDPIESNFVKYFALNFKKFGLKKLIATCYAGSTVADTEFVGDLWNLDKEKPIAYKLEITDVTDLDGDGAITMHDIELLLTDKTIVKPLIGDGDFRSKECIALLDDADICVTNPPFSLLKEFISLMIAKDKKFLILANMNTFKAKELFPLFKDGKFWAGYKFNFQTIFNTPYVNTTKANRDFVLNNGGNPDAGDTKVPGLAWFTNMPVATRNEPLTLYKIYDAETYPVFDTYAKAINVDKVADIPCDYFGEIGVPETFVGKHDPEQFTLVGILNGGRIPGLDFAVPYVNGKKVFTRLIIKRKYKDDSSLNN